MSIRPEPLQPPALGPFALAAMHQQDEERGIDPHAPSKVIDLGPAPPRPPSLRELLEASPIDWHEEERQRRAAEERERTAAAQTTVARLAESERPDPPQPPKWTAQQMRPGA